MATERIRATYTKDQIAAYFERLKIPEISRHYDVSTLDDENALQYLALLQKQHLTEIPFENLTLHYSTYRRISVHPQDVFKKIIGDNNGRGGYCMENNTLFGTLLHSLGFSIYSGGGRVNEGDRWTGWGHMVNLITIGETKFHVDVGFGGDAPIVPMPLDRSGTVQPHFKPAETRLQWRNISANTDPSQRLWVYEYRRDNASEWETKYCFTELEFVTSDWNVLNFHTSTSHSVFFTRTILVEKKIMDEEGNLSGNLILFGNTIKWRIHGVKEKEIEFKTEAERLEALEKYFGIRFGEAERDGIHGLGSEIKG